MRPILKIGEADSYRDIADSITADHGIRPGGNYLTNVRVMLYGGNPQGMKKLEFGWYSHWSGKMDYSDALLDDLFYVGFPFSEIPLIMAPLPMVKEVLGKDGFDSLHREPIEEKSIWFAMPRRVFILYQFITRFSGYLYYETDALIISGIGNIRDREKMLALLWDEREHYEGLLRHIFHLYPYLESFEGSGLKKFSRELRYPLSSAW